MELHGNSHGAQIAEFGAADPRDHAASQNQASSENQTQFSNRGDGFFWVFCKILKWGNCARKQVNIHVKLYLFIIKR